MNEAIRFHELVRLWVLMYGEDAVARAARLWLGIATFVLWVQAESGANPLDVAVSIDSKNPNRINVSWSYVEHVE